MGCRQITLVRVTIPNTAQVQAYLAETPASLTLLTPNAAVQVEIRDFKIDDNRPLLEAQSSR